MANRVKSADEQRRRFVYIVALEGPGEVRRLYVRATDAKAALHYATPKATVRVAEHDEIIEALRGYDQETIHEAEETTNGE